MPWTTSYYHADALGSTRALTDDGEVVTDRYVYDAFGNQRQATGSTVNPFRYVGLVGYYYDQDSENYYVRARYYNPRIIRWLSVDPIGFWTGDMNLFQYVGNTPVVDTDPQGLQKAAVKAFQPACCTYIRYCNECNWWAANDLIVTERTSEAFHACPVEFDNLGRPLYTPRKCCESHRPSSIKLRCTAYSVDTATTKGCGKVWPADCDRQLTKWILQAGNGLGSPGHLLCLAWCEKCVGKGRNWLTKNCQDNICEPSFS